jgi:hypothetical protein
MFTVNYKDTGELRRFRRELPKIGRRIVVRVANDAVPVAQQAILDGWNVSPDIVGSSLRVDASKDSAWLTGLDKPNARIIARSRRLNLLDFNATQTPTGVSFEVQKGRRQDIKHAFIAETARGYGRQGGKSKKAVRRIIKNLRRDVNRERWEAKASGFTAKYTAATKKYQLQRALIRASGLTRSGVFIRESSARLPIKALYGGSVQSFFASAMVRGKIKRFVDRAIPEYLDIEIKQFFGGQ